MLLQRLPLFTLLSQNCVKMKCCRADRLASSPPDSPTHPGARTYLRRANRWTVRTVAAASAMQSHKFSGQRDFSRRVPLHSVSPPSENPLRPNIHENPTEGTDTEQREQRPKINLFRVNILPSQTSHNYGDLRASRVFFLLRLCSAVDFSTGKERGEISAPFLFN